MTNEPMASLPGDDVAVSLQKHIGVVEIRRPPDNFFDVTLLDAVAEGVGRLVAEPACRAIVLASAGKTFCAGAKFSTSGPGGGSARSGSRLYAAALQLFRCPKPVVAAVQGPAIGGGLGLALVADFRVVAPEARFAANFVKLGIHPGFGITATLPRVVGQQRAALMLYTGRRVKAEEALGWGLADLLVPQEQLRAAAVALATEVAEAAPLAVQATRATMRAGLAELVQMPTEHELSEQAKLFATADFREGVRAVAERRAGRFAGA
jgi:enoyl-CoA hydratase/carnithine racemase